jgi:lysophospholipase L1-like esterase
MSKDPMTKAWLYAGLVVAGGVGTAYLVSSIHRPLIKRGDRILLVGDSLSVGLNPPLRALAKEAGFEFAHIGKVGSLTNLWANEAEEGGQFSALLRSFKPTIVLVSLGTNDEWLPKYNPGKSVLASQRQHVDKLMAKIRAAGAEVLWVGPPAHNQPPALDFREYIQKLIGRTRYFHSERYTIPRQPPPDNVPHPTVKGYAAWAGVIWRWLGTGHAPGAIAPNALDGPRRRR